MKRITTTQKKKKNPVGSTSTVTTITTQPKQAKRKTKKNKRVRMGTLLSPCAADYARALANPFSGPLACLPSLPALMTRRIRTFAKGVFTTSMTNSFGYILIEPSNFVANDVDCVACSTAASTVTVAANTVALDPNIALFRSNSEYTQAQIGPGAGLIAQRVVAAGVRIRYIGTNLNAGGIVVGLQEPDHDPLVGSGIALFDAQMESKRLPVDRRWSTVLYRPAISLEYYFRDTVGGTGGWYMGFVVNSAAPAQNFEFEAYAVLELEGRTVRGKTPSHADPVGQAAVNSCASTTDNLYPTSKTDEEREQGMLKTSLNYILDNMSGIDPVGVGKAAGFATNAYINMHRARDGQYPGPEMIM